MTRKILSACGLIDALYNVLICMEDYAVLRKRSSRFEITNIEDMGTSEIFSILESNQY